MELINNIGNISKVKESTTIILLNVIKGMLYI